ncbi:Nucleotidyl transferase AbiEii toxin, Type IV TA system [Candidatus Gugararchaeum adminiculabundum]|nr:Nucleotidyl transferase AbiEii toxin, Type IV TA system [Candidatus Gugararchaeum adminiculabundum]
MNIPLEKRLKKRAHIDVGLLQDEVTEVLYSLENRLVFHGGTAVWRCYGGNRFSEDLDFYCSDATKVEEGLKERLEARGLNVDKFKKTGNLIFCKVSGADMQVRVEINFSSKPAPPVAKPFEKIDGSFMSVLTLSPEDLILEKCDAYANRLFVRDIYDIFHLSNFVKGEPKAKQRVLLLLKSIKPPVDEKNLKAIVYSGNIPSFKQMVEFLQGRFA